MKHENYINGKFDKNETVYFLEEYEEIVVRFVPLKNTYKCFAKMKGKGEYEINRSGSLAMSIEASGIIITKAEYDNYSKSTINENKNKYNSDNKSEIRDRQKVKEELEKMEVKEKQISHSQVEKLMQKLSKRSGVPSSRKVSPSGTASIHFMKKLPKS